MGGCRFEGWCIFAPDTALEGGSEEGRMLVEGDLGGHCSKMGRSTIEEEAEMWD
jgi:hypothetical protein